MICGDFFSLKKKNSIELICVFIFLMILILRCSSVKDIDRENLLGKYKWHGMELQVI